MDQRRSELRAGLDDVGPFETLRAKFARTRYTHTELEGAEVGTVFDNDGLEGRLELVHRPLRSEEHTSELQSLMRISSDVFCLKTTNNTYNHSTTNIRPTLEV